MSNSAFSLSLLLVIIFASLGGFIAKKFKFQPFIGYLVFGVILGALFPFSKEVSQLADVGVILLLFCLGLELSFSKLQKVFKAALIGGVLQIILFSLLGFIFFLGIGFDKVTSIVFSLALSLSSTAVVVKILSDRGEEDTVHGTIMSGWLLVQDLAVIPIVIFMSSLAGGGSGWLGASLSSLLKAFYVIVVVVILGRHVVPYIFHKIASVNSRELLIISALGFSGAVAYITYLLGISPSLGAFLAGLVISESLENHAVLGEVRPLRDLFVAIFFVTLGFMIKPQIVFSNFGLILLIFAFTILIKSLINFIICEFLGYKGKTAVSISLGLSQVGEFSFVIFSLGLSLGILPLDKVSLGTASVLLTLLVTPFLFKSAVPFWKRLKGITAKIPWLNKLFVGGEKGGSNFNELAGHIVICGYGRVGGWVGHALTEVGTPFVIVDYNQDVVSELRKKGLPVIYGDPGEPEVLEAAGIRSAKAVVLAIPDRVSQEILIGYVQTVAPDVKIISRVHLDEDWERLKTMRVSKIIQPEFEAAIAMTRTILISMGKSKEEVEGRLKKLRISRSLIK